MENANPKPLEVVSHVETKELALLELERVEVELAARLGIPRPQLRRRVVAMLRAGELDEDAVVTRWLAAYDVAMEYASAGPPQRSSTKDDQGPQDAALAAFGP
jgi:hypothetical protein